MTADSVEQQVIDGMELLRWEWTTSEVRELTAVIKRDPPRYNPVLSFLSGVGAGIGALYLTGLVVPLHSVPQPLWFVLLVGLPLTAAGGTVWATRRLGKWNFSETGGEARVPPTDAVLITSTGIRAGTKSILWRSENRRLVGVRLEHHPWPTLLLRFSGLSRTGLSVPIPRRLSSDVAEIARLLTARTREGVDTKRVPQAPKPPAESK